MALIKCPECGKEYSEYAESCPICGNPTAALRQSSKNNEYVHDFANNNTQTNFITKKRKRSWRFFLAILLILGVIIIIGYVGYANLHGIPLVYHSSDIIKDSTECTIDSSTNNKCEDERIMSFISDMFNNQYSGKNRFN